MAAVTFSKLVSSNKRKECTAYLGENTIDAPKILIEQSPTASNLYRAVNRWITVKGGYKSEYLTNPRPLRETKAMAARMLTCGAFLGLGDREMEWAEGADRNQIRDHVENGTPLPTPDATPEEPGTPSPTLAPEHTEEEIAEEITERHTTAPKPDAARYYGEYYRAGQMPPIPGGALARVHRSPYRAGLFAMIFGHGMRPLALVGPFAEVQDMADNLAAREIRLFRRLNAKHAIKADAERGKAMESGELKRRAVQPRAKLERVK